MQRPRVVDRLLASEEPLIEISDRELIELETYVSYLKRELRYTSRHLRVQPLFPQSEGIRLEVTPRGNQLTHERDRLLPHLEFNKRLREDAQSKAMMRPVDEFPGQVDPEEESPGEEPPPWQDKGKSVDERLRLLQEHTSTAYRLGPRELARQVNTRSHSSVTQTKWYREDRKLLAQAEKEAQLAEARERVSFAIPLALRNLALKTSGRPSGRWSLSRSPSQTALPFATALWSPLLVAPGR